ncbi:MAG: phosphoglycerate kinase [Deltaproteobacteria bacterium]|jgi:phosphoglycerate kinase|nr:phosphoglycerate kinase [Deltaproteobacteria bacterium]
MEAVDGTGIRSVAQGDYRGKTVLLRLDINCPVDPQTRTLRNANRIEKSMPTLRHLLKQGAKVAIIAHQGDSQDYKSLIPLEEHAQRLAALLGSPVPYVDDPCGPEAQKAVRALGPGQAVLLGNLRYLTEEVTAFEFALSVEPREYLNCYLVRSLAPLVDAYVNDAFSAAHRNAPSMVAFQELLPTAAGFLLFDEMKALSAVLENPAQPAVYLLGGSRISDAYGMMGAVLAKGSAHSILTCGVTALVMLMAKGKSLGSRAEEYIRKRGFESFLPESERLLAAYGDTIKVPVDLCIEAQGRRKDIRIDELPVEADLFDIGDRTIALYAEEIAGAGTVFVNGPPGVYENPLFEKGTKELFLALQNARGYTVVGGGDSVTAAAKYVDLQKINHVCTAGGAMVHYLSGQDTPLVTAMRKAFREKRF